MGTDTDDGAQLGADDMGDEWATYPASNTGGGSSSLVWSGKLVDTGGQGDDGSGYVAAVPVQRNAAGVPTLTIAAPTIVTAPPMVQASPETKKATALPWLLLAAVGAKLAGLF